MITGILEVRHRFSFQSAQRWARIKGLWLVALCGFYRASMAALELAMVLLKAFQCVSST